MNELAVVIDYTNWRGERRFHRVQPLEIKFTFNEWHPQLQWILVAIDLEDGAYQEKGFAMQNIHSLKPASIVIELQSPETRLRTESIKERK